MYVYVYVSRHSYIACTTCNNDFHTTCTNLKTRASFKNVNNNWSCEISTFNLKMFHLVKKLTLILTMNAVKITY